MPSGAPRRKVSSSRSCMAARGNPLDSVIDINPAKQGRYLPATGLRVQSPGRGDGALCRPGADMFVMNTNYLDEIRGIDEPPIHTCIASGST